MAQAGRANSIHCPAARLAREAAVVIVARGRADRAMAGGLDVLQERLDAIEDACTYEKATSSLGAFYQILLLHGDISEDELWVAGGPTSARAVRRLRRLAASIARCLETQIDRDTAAELRSYYLTRDIDEIARLDQLLATAVH